MDINGFSSAQKLVPIGFDTSPCLKILLEGQQHHATKEHGYIVTFPKTPYYFS